MKVAEVMTRDVVTLQPEQTLDEAAKVLVETGISGAPVVDEAGRVVGMLTERDLLSTQVAVKPPRYLELLGGIIYLDDVAKFKRQLQKAMAVKVSEAMTAEVSVVEEDDPLHKAIELVMERRINRLPVVDGQGKLVGIVTRSDLLRGTLAR